MEFYDGQSLDILPSDMSFPQICYLYADDHGEARAGQSMYSFEVCILCIACLATLFFCYTREIMFQHNFL